MKLEIERKFLVRNDSWRSLVQQSHGLRQGFLSTVKERVVRVRIEAGHATLTIKGVIRGLTKNEFEYAIPEEEARFMLEQLCQRPLIEKVRHYLQHHAQEWVIDEFQGENQGLILAEAELTAENQPLAIPEWAGQEVSHDPRYVNSNLAMHPYTHWGLANAVTAAGGD